MDWSSCDRGPADLRPELYVCDSGNSPGVLVLKFASFARREIDLPPRYVRLLLAAAEAWTEDSGLIEALRGFRTAAELGDRFSLFSNESRGIREKAVRAYVYEVSCVVRKEAVSYGAGNGSATGTDLFERRRLRGYRVGVLGLEVNPI